MYIPERERERQNIAAELTLFDQLIPEKTLRILRIPGTLKEQSAGYAFKRAERQTEHRRV